MTEPLDLHHVDEGAPGGPAVLLGASLGTTHRMWDALAADLARDFRVVRFDTRGHGESPAPAASYTLEELAADVVALADRLGIDRFAYAGLSLGGAIGQRLGIDHGDRLTSLALCSTAPVFGTPEMWEERAETVRSQGTQALVDATVERWFTPEFRAEHADQVSWVMDMFRATPDQGYAGCCAAIARFDATDELPAIRVPTVVVAGAEDPTCPPSVGEAMVESIPDAELVVIDDVAHISNVARPEAFNAAIRAHLEKHR